MYLYIYHKKCSKFRSSSSPIIFQSFTGSPKPNKSPNFFALGAWFFPTIFGRTSSGRDNFYNETPGITVVTGRWQLTHFVVSPVVGEMIQFDEYFSNGLVQPPTRLTVKN